MEARAAVDMALNENEKRDVIGSEYE